VLAYREGQGQVALAQRQARLIQKPTTKRQGQAKQELRVELTNGLKQKNWGKKEKSRHIKRKREQD
jgi:hypothetical protein